MIRILSLALATAAVVAPVPAQGAIRTERATEGRAGSADLQKEITQMRAELRQLEQEIDKLARSMGSARAQEKEKGKEKEGERENEKAPRAREEKAPRAMTFTVDGGQMVVEARPGEGMVLTPGQKSVYVLQGGKDGKVERRTMTLEPADRRQAPKAAKVVPAPQQGGCTCDCPCCRAHRGETGAAPAPGGFVRTLVTPMRSQVIAPGTVLRTLIDGANTPTRTRLQGLQGMRMVERLVEPPAPPKPPAPPAAPKKAKAKKVVVETENSRLISV